MGFAWSPNTEGLRASTQLTPRRPPTPTPTQLPSIDSL